MNCIYRPRFSNYRAKMKRSGFLALLLTIPSLVCADVVELKSGEKIEGRIVLRTTKEIIIEVDVTPTIKDEQRIPMSEVANVSRSLGDEPAWREIEKMRLATVITEPSYYDRIIATKLDPFIEKFSYSDYLPAVRQKKQELIAERDRMAETGEVRVDGEWLTPAQREAEAYHWEPYILLAQMKEYLDQGAHQAVLVSFDAMQKNYSKSEFYPESANIAREAANRLLTLTNQAINSLQRKLQDRERSLEIMSEDEKIRVKAAIEREEKQAKEAYDRAKASGRKFLPVIPNNMEALKELKKSVEDELRRIDQLDLTTARQAVAKAREAREQLERKELALAETTIQEAQAIWADSEFIKRIAERIAKEKEAVEKASAEQAAAVEKAIRDREALEKNAGNPEQLPRQP